MVRRIAMLAKAGCLAAVMTCLVTAPATAKTTKKKASGTAAMGMHHMHTMMNHGLIMVMQGSNLVMLSEMKMAPGVDEKTMGHGRKMMAEGKAMLQEMLAGKEMAAMHKGGDASSPLMVYTHDLGGAMQAVVTDVEKMKMTDPGTPEAMK